MKSLSESIPDKTITLKNGVIYLILKKSSNSIIGVYSNEKTARDDLESLGSKTHKLEARQIDYPNYH